MDLRNRVADAAVEGRNPIGAEWRCSKGAGGNPLIHNSSDLCPFIHNSFRRWLHEASGGGGIFAIKQDVEPGVPVFVFLATSSVGGRVFKRLDEAVAWLDGLVGAA